MLCLIPVVTGAQGPDSVLFYCSNSKYDPVPGNTYRANLISFLYSSVNASRTDVFYNSTVRSASDPSDTVYGLVMCRGDVSNDLCEDCVSKASQEVLNYCSDQKIAFTWYDTCFLRYSNRSFYSAFSAEDARIGLCAINANNVTEPEKFQVVVNDTMNKLADQAANDTQPDKKFAVGEANFSTSQSVYPLVQCTPDLSSADCRRCLSSAISLLPTCCNDHRGCRIAFPSCVIWYELFRFYNISSPSSSKGKALNLSWLLLNAGIFLLVFKLGYWINSNYGKDQAISFRFIFITSRKGTNQGP